MRTTSLWTPTYDAKDAGNTKMKEKKATKPWYAKFLSNLFKDLKFSLFLISLTSEAFKTLLCVFCMVKLSPFTPSKTCHYLYFLDIRRKNSCLRKSGIKCDKIIMNVSLDFNTRIITTTSAFKSKNKNERFLQWCLFSHECQYYVDI